MSDITIVILLNAAILAVVLWTSYQRRREDTELIESLRARHKRDRAAAEEAREELLSEWQKRLARLERERDKLTARAHLPLAKDLFAGLDDLERALAIAREHEGEDAELTRGLDMVTRSLHAALADHDITPIRPADGDAFDPQIHEAVSIEEREDAPATTAVDTLYRTGWRHETGVLRPAMVQVVRGYKAADASPKPPAPSKEEVAFAFEEEEHAREDEHTLNADEPTSDEAGSHDTTQENVPLPQEVGVKTS